MVTKFVASTALLMSFCSSSAKRLATSPLDAVILTLRNTKAITALTITIKVAQTTGVTPNGGYNRFPGGIATTRYGSGSGSGTLTSTYVLNAGRNIPANSRSGSFAAQYRGTGSARVQTGDTWTVVSTSNGVTSTLSGHF